MLVLQEVQLGEQDRNLLGTFANQAALAVDRAQLREQALRARLLEEIDRWRSALMGAASHDLRTPLASIKTAVSSLRQDGASSTEPIGPNCSSSSSPRSDRLARLVTNLLDMTRIESGALELARRCISFEELVDEALRVRRPGRPSPVTRDAACRPSPASHRPRPHQPGPGQPAGECRAAVTRAARSGSAARVAPGTTAPGRDLGGRRRAGIATEDRERRIRDVQPERRRGSGRARAGHRQGFRRGPRGAIWIDPEVDPGARVVFTVPGEAFVRREPEACA